MYQIISNYRNGKFSARVEPQDYWCDPIGGEEIMGSHMSLEEAKEEVASYNR